MGWVKDALKELAAGRHAQVRPSGGSMRGRIESGQLVTIAPMEVSGIGNGSETDIRRRRKIKLEQTERSDAMHLPAIVVIIEFSRPVAEVVQR